MLIIVVRFIVKQQHLSLFNQRMRQQAKDSLEREPACRRFDIGSDATDPRKIFLYEIYDDAAAFDMHLASPHFQSFNAQTQDWIESKIVERWDGPWE
ncbi:MAG TPA: putative quinol monooxygenase [Rhizomicrobium sp.]|jgi:quinol monooxygenase YgiN|nr:putative quinol monooxygenase [Rhizomicrobium sp.]